VPRGSTVGLQITTTAGQKLAPHPCPNPLPISNAKPNPKPSLTNLKFKIYA